MKKRNTQSVKRQKRDSIDDFIRDLEQLGADFGKAQTVPELKKWLVRLLTAAAQIAAMMDRFERQPPNDKTQREAIQTVLNDAPSTINTLLREASETLEKLEWIGGDD